LVVALFCELRKLQLAQRSVCYTYGSEGCRFESCRAHKQYKRFCLNRIALLQRITVTSVCASKRLIERQ